jgi:hypothetical protein
MGPREGGIPKRDAGLPRLPAEVWEELLTHVQDVAQQVEQRLQDALRDPLCLPPQASARKPEASSPAH